MLQFRQQPHTRRAKKAQSRLEVQLQLVGYGQISSHIFESLHELAMLKKPVLTLGNTGINSPQGVFDVLPANFQRIGDARLISNSGRNGVCTPPARLVVVARPASWKFQSTSDPARSERKINRSPEFIRDEFANDAGPIARSTGG